MVFMETYLDFDGAWYGTGVKVLADQTVWSLYLNACYSFLIGTFALRDPREVWKDVKATSWPALRSSWRFWPFVHCISFSHLVPLDLKLLWACRSMDPYPYRGSLCYLGNPATSCH